MRRLVLILGLWMAAGPALGQTYQLEAPMVVLNDVPFDVTVKSNDILIYMKGVPAQPPWRFPRPFPLVSWPWKPSGPREATSELPMWD